jgi:hypothetical protein
VCCDPCVLEENAFLVESHIWKMLAHFFLFSLVTHSLFSILFLLQTIIDLEMNVSTTCTGSIYLQDDDSIADQHPQGISPSTRSHEDPLESFLPGGPAGGCPRRWSHRWSRDGFLCSTTYHEDLASLRSRYVFPRIIVLLC